MREFGKGIGRSWASAQIGTPVKHIEFYYTNVGFGNLTVGKQSTRKRSMASNKPGLTGQFNIENQSIDLNILDEETKAKLLKCINDHGKIKISVTRVGSLDTPDGGRFAQQID